MPLWRWENVSGRSHVASVGAQLVLQQVRAASLARINAGATAKLTENIFLILSIVLCHFSLHCSAADPMLSNERNMVVPMGQHPSLADAHTSKHQ